MIRLSASSTRKAALLAGTLLLGACGSLSYHGAVPPAATLAIRGVNVIDVSGGPVLERQTVLVGDGRVLAVGREDRVRIPRGAQVVDGSGRYLIPGLWDMHVHLFLHPDSVVGMRARAWETYVPLLLANGVTGVRDMGGVLDSLLAFRAELGEGSRPGPVLRTAGPTLAGPSPWATGSPHVWTIGTAAGARDAVDSLRAVGVDFVKVHDFIAPEIFAALAGLARERGLPLVGHLGAVPPGEASEAGLAGIEHLAPEIAAFCAPGGAERRGRFYTEWRAGGTPAYMSGMRDLWQSRDGATCAELLGRLRENGTAVTPTLVHRLQDESMLTAPGSEYRGPDAERACGVAATGVAAVPAEVRDAFTRSVRSQVKAIHDAGIRLLAGTDGPSGCLVPGFSLHAELEHLSAAGLTPLEVLQTATRNPAEFLGMGETHGTIAVGKAADLVLLDANPLEDVRNTRRIGGVVLNGRWLSHASLRQLVVDGPARRRYGRVLRTLARGSVRAAPPTGRRTAVHQRPGRRHGGDP